MKKLVSCERMHLTKEGRQLTQGLSSRDRLVLALELGQKVQELERYLTQWLKKRLSTPGTFIPEEPGVPLYSVDSDDPSVLIRRLDGKEDRGVMVNGQFEAFMPLPPPDVVYKLLLGRSEELKSGVEDTTLEVSAADMYDPSWER